MNHLGFWQKLKKPIIVLAPMADVTDAAFRRIIAKYSKWQGQDIGDGTLQGLPAKTFRLGGPDVMWTEFVSADGLILASKEGREKLMLDLVYSEAERPIVAQLFGANPKTMEKAATLVAELGFDGLDINMGCPDRSILKQGAGAAMMKNVKQAKLIIKSAKQGIASVGKNIPVSVKTRIGYNRPELEEWLPALLEEELALVTIHARTRKEMSDVPARWEFVKRAVEIRNEMKSQTLIFGNGDVEDVALGRSKCEETGADGVMLGRAIFGNPFLFANLFHSLRGRQIEHPSEAFGEGGYVPTLEKKLSVLVEHTKLFEELLGDVKNFAIMKKHFKAYVNGFEGAKELRVKLMEAGTGDEVDSIVTHFLKSTSVSV